MTVGNKTIRPLLNPSEEEALVRLIAKVERKTTGEIRIHLAHHTTKAGGMADARKIFTKLGIHKTKNRNGVLIFASLRDHDLVCVGDEGIHQKVGDQFWAEAVSILKSTFKKGDFFIGLHKAVQFIGKALAEHFPADPADKNQENINELPDEISKD